MAHWLLTMFMMTGAWCTAAKMMPWWKSASALEPSPIQVQAMWSSLRMAAAMAQPTACGNWVVRLPEIEKMRPAFQ